MDAAMRRLLLFALVLQRRTEALEGRNGLLQRHAALVRPAP